MVITRSSSAVAATWALMSGLILAGGFGFLLNMCALLFIVGYLAMVLGVFRLRRRDPGASRPFRAWGFPATGLVCAVGWAGIATFVGLMDLKSAGYSLALAGLSVPAFFWIRSRQRP